MPAFHSPSATRGGRSVRSVRGKFLAALVLAGWLLPGSAQAAFLKGETLDQAANVLTWVVLLVAPVVGIAVFLLVHILPEKIAEKKQHPQAKAIQCLCLLSLVFGGLLWPLAWLWAFTRPVLYKMAYGTDKVPHEHDETTAAPHPDEPEELRQLRQRVAELEKKLADKPASEGGKA